MIQWLIELDKKLLLYVNSMHSPTWDAITGWASGKMSWILLYAGLLLFIIYKERPYRFIFTILFVAITVMLCDQISMLIKYLVEHPRPSYHTEFGFLSSHATSVFGLAAFLSNQFKHFRWSLFLFAWAVLVAYSRVYLGMNYPLDVICGAVLGALTGIHCHMIKVWTVVYIERFIADRQAVKRQAKRHEERWKKLNNI